MRRLTLLTALAALSLYIPNSTLVASASQSESKEELIFNSDSKLLRRDRQCAVFNGGDWADYFESNAACRDGLLNGSGFITYYKNNRIVWRHSIGPGHGVNIRDGRYYFSLDRDAWRIKISCGDGWEGFNKVVRGKARIDVPGNLDISTSWVMQKVIVLSQEELERQCKSEETPNVYHIFIDGDSMDRQLTAEYVILKGGNRERFKIYNNYYHIRMSKSIENENRQLSHLEYQKAQQEKERRRTQDLSKAEQLWGEFLKSEIESERPIGNVADYISYSASQFIIDFSNGRQVALLYQNPSFKDGKIIVTNYLRQTFVEDNAYKIHSSLDWVEWYSFSQVRQFGSTLTVSCHFEPDTITKYAEGRLYVVNATLIELASDKILTLSCR